MLNGKHDGWDEFAANIFLAGTQRFLREGWQQYRKQLRQSGVRSCVVEPGEVVLGLGRTVVSETEAPNIIANLG
jgi:hypothetical protein